MTDQQLTALKALAERFNSSLEYTDVMHSPWGLPSNWIQAVIMRPEEGKAAHLCEKIAIVAGISPKGSIHT